MTDVAQTEPKIFSKSGGVTSRSHLGGRVSKIISKSGGVISKTHVGGSGRGRRLRRLVMQIRAGVVHVPPSRPEDHPHYGTEPAGPIPAVGATIALVIIVRALLRGRRA